jgi:hypothetical protein
MTDEISRRFNEIKSAYNGVIDRSLFSQLCYNFLKDTLQAKYATEAQKVCKRYLKLILIIFVILIFDGLTGIRILAVETDVGKSYSNFVYYLLLIPNVFFLLRIVHLLFKYRITRNKHLVVCRSMMKTIADQPYKWTFEKITMTQRYENGWRIVQLILQPNMDKIPNIVIIWFFIFYLPTAVMYESIKNSLFSISAKFFLSIILIPIIFFVNTSLLICGILVVIGKVY